MSTDTYSSGQGGNLTINANRFYAQGNSSIGASTFEEVTGGDAGNLVMNLQQLQLVSGAYIASSTFGSGNTGDLTINASESFDLYGFESFSSGIGATGIYASGELGSTGNGGNLFINTGQLNVRHGAEAAVNMLGTGKAGNIVIRAGEIEVSEPIVDFGGTTSGIVASLESQGSGTGGSIDIQANRLRLTNGGQILALTNGAGDAGSIVIRANEIELDGSSPDVSGNSSELFRSSISARSSTDFSAGSIQITGDRLSVRDGAQITVSNSSTGDSGNLTINTNSLTLNNSARLSAEVNGGSQGNLTIQAHDLLMLRHGSSIETNATGRSTGGNISIEAPIILGLENSDIIANAVGGRGGNINITTQGIIGLEFRNTLIPRTEPTNDITASSQFSVNGTVQINNLGVDPNAGLVNLPVDLADPTLQIAQGCAVTQDSRFVVTGRGGLPDDPTQALRSDRPWTDLRNLSTAESAPSTRLSSTSSPLDNQTSPVTEATRWTIDRQGQIELVASQQTDPAIGNGATCAGNQL